MVILISFAWSGAGTGPTFLRAWRSFRSQVQSSRLLDRPIGLSLIQTGHARPAHSITSSARARTEAGIARPSGRAVRRLTTTSNRSGDSTMVVPSEYLEIVITKR